MRVLFFIVLLFILSGCASKVKGGAAITGGNVSFSEVWNEVASDTLEKLPQNEISFFKLEDGEGDILKDSQRTLDDHRDILKPFNKLAHPNGICFKGVWEIDTENIYSGYFKNGSQALIIARASSAMSKTRTGETRAFGFAGKLFPTTDKNQIIDQNSANFFLIDDLGGTDAKYFTEVELINEPPVSITFEMIKNLLYALKVSRTFSEVDKNPGIRQLYEISEFKSGLVEDENKNIITPKWMMIKAKDIKKIEVEDFRDELKIIDKSLVFNIFVANKILNDKKDWKKIGKITLDTSVVSNSCDHRLHFHHPKWRGDLNYGFYN